MGETGVEHRRTSGAPGACVITVVVVQVQTFLDFFRGYCWFETIRRAPSDAHCPHLGGNATVLEQTSIPDMSTTSPQTYTPSKAFSEVNPRHLARCLITADHNRGWIKSGRRAIYSLPAILTSHTSHITHHTSHITHHTSSL
jgi:hypothetical protein